MCVWERRGGDGLHLPVQQSRPRGGFLLWPICMVNPYFFLKKVPASGLGAADWLSPQWGAFFLLHLHTPPTTTVRFANAGGAFFLCPPPESGSRPWQAGGRCSDDPVPSSSSLVAEQGEASLSKR